jgi:hypothetical protein
MPTLTIFRRQPRQSRDAADHRHQLIHLLTRPRDEEIDPLRAQQDRPLQPTLLADRDQTLAQPLQIRQRSKEIAGNVRDGQVSSHRHRLC